MNPQILIIGAGMAGLTAARELNRAGFQTRIIDKGRGVGGRMATRRMGAARCDHGAQYFSAKTATFQALLHEAAQDGVVKNFRPAHLEDGHDRWIGTEGMTSLPKYLARGLEVLNQERVVKISQGENAWEVYTDTGKKISAAAIIVAIPAPQALGLLVESDLPLPATTSVLSGIDYHPCLAVLVRLAAPAQFPDSTIALSEYPISWIADNYRKGITKEPTLTIHASSAFSRTHLDGDLENAGKQLLELAFPHTGELDIASWQIHRWRYSLAHRRYPQAFHRAATRLPLLFGGDGFGMGNVEGAFVSGMEMAEEVKKG